MQMTKTRFTFLFLLLTMLFMAFVSSSAVWPTDRSCSIQDITQLSHSDKSYISVYEFPFQKTANEVSQIAFVPTNFFIRLSSKISLHRLVRFNQIAQHNFLTFEIGYKNQCELLQSNGYYLFYLCKLLI